MLSWILLVVLLLGMTDLLIVLDKGISVQANSLVYLNALFLLVFAVFVIWRYRKEMKYTTKLTVLAREMHDDWLEALERPEQARDEMVDELLEAIDEYYKRKLSDLRQTRLLESDALASWIHEIKAPLTAMKLIMDAHPHDPAMRTIETEWLRMYLLVDRQLYITRLPSLESDYMPEETPIQGLAAKEVRELTSWCLAKNLAVEFEGENVEVTTDRKWCRFILRQILVNAVKYSPEGGTIRVETGRTPAGHTVLVIQDEGPGIPAHDLPRIFDKGFTGGQGRIHNAATGLGLYLARVVGEKIGVTLAAESVLGEGTALRLTFTAGNAFETVRKEMYKASR
ncbi:sensor histidine kinase [Paenibacillus sp. CAA11]|nr:sensor histidine kinase [Paenibacillus sp. CAA11]